MPVIGYKQSAYLHKLNVEGGEYCFPHGFHHFLIKRGLISVEKTGPARIVRNTITEKGIEMLEMYPHNQEASTDG